MRAIVAAVSVAAWTTVASGQGCAPHWSDEFATGDLDGSGYALAWFDDGTGPALYVGGQFATAGGAPANNIAKWDGSSWSPLAGGVNEWIRALTVFDDGSGPALYAGGRFTTAGGVQANNIAKWDGASWSPLGSGVNEWVGKLTVFDDGSGPALYAAGKFTEAGGAPASQIAKWDGAFWSPLGPGVSGFIRGMAVYDDGGGTALHVATATSLARWTGQSWETTPPPPYAPVSGHIWDLAVWDDGAGPALYAAGGFEDNGVWGGLARLHGGQWELLESPFLPFTLGPIDVGGRQVMGCAVQETGGSAGSVGASIDGVWHHLGDLDDVPSAMLRVEGPAGPRTYLAGRLNAVGGNGVRGIATWDGAAWSALIAPRGIRGLVRTLHAGAERVYAGGWFRSAGSAPAVRVAAYEGGVWSALDPGFLSTCGGGGIPSVESLLEVDLPSAKGVVAGGLFGWPSEAIAIWDGTSWADMAQGFSVVMATDTCAVVMNTAVFDDGSGPALFATGFFDSPVWGIARWTGTAWADVAGGVGVHPLWNEKMGLCVHDDGTGAALYVGGWFGTVGGPGGLSVSNVARWNGQRWSRAGEGLVMHVLALEEFDDGTGPALFAAGTSPAGGEVWRWNGATWTQLGGIFDGEASALAAFDDGTGAALYVGGSFTSIDGRPARGLARWDGSQWIEVNGGVAMLGQTASVNALEPVPHEGVWSLLVGGWFSTVGQSVDSQNIARLIGCQPACYPDCDQSTGVGVLDIFDFLCFQNSFVNGETYACDCDTTTGNGVCDVFDFLCFQNAFVGGCP